MQVGQGVLGPVVVRVIIRIDGLRLQSRDGIELFDRRGLGCPSKAGLDYNSTPLRRLQETMLVSSINVWQQGVPRRI